VGNHRRPNPPSRARISVLTAAAAATVAVSSNAGAQAAPQPTVGQVQAQIDALHPATDKAVEAYDRAQAQQQALQKEVALLQDQVARQQAAVTKTMAVLGSVAAAQYRSGSVDPSVQLMLSGDPTNYLNRASLQGQVSAGQAAQLQGLLTEQALLAREKKQAQTALAALDATAKQMAQAKTAVQAKLAQAQKLMDSLTASQRAALTAKQNQAATAAAKTVNLGNAKASSAAAAAAFAAAKTRLGSPYVWGATGPGSFDCSGLMQWAYAQAGISLPRTTYSQDTVGTVVPLSQAQVGDLVFFNGDTHVGMYAGNNTVLHAPHTGTVVKFESISTIGSVVDVRRL
jgi:cell wall-associated NlpC family hydrolase